MSDYGGDKHLKMISDNIMRLIVKKSFIERVYRGHLTAILSCHVLMCSFYQLLNHTISTGLT